MAANPDFSADVLNMLAEERRSSPDRYAAKRLGALLECYGIDSHTDPADFADVICALHEHSTEKNDIGSLLQGTKDVLNYASERHTPVCDLVRCIGIAKREYPALIESRYQRRMSGIRRVYAKRPIARLLLERRERKNHACLRIDDWTPDMLALAAQYIHDSYSQPE